MSCSSYILHDLKLIFVECDPKPLDAVSSGVYGLCPVGKIFKNLNPLSVLKTLLVTLVCAFLMVGVIAPVFSHPPTLPVPVPIVAQYTLPSDLVEVTDSPFSGIDPITHLPSVVETRSSKLRLYLVPQASSWLAQTQEIKTSGSVASPLQPPFSSRPSISPTPFPTNSMNATIHRIVIIEARIAAETMQTSFRPHESRGSRPIRS